MFDLGAECRGEWSPLQGGSVPTKQLHWNHVQFEDHRELIAAQMVVLSSNSPSDGLCAWSSLLQADDCDSTSAS
jgi:hypothetical protein